MKILNNPRSLLAVFLLAMLVSPLVPHVYSSTLALTVFTTKPSYLVADNITVYGILTYDGSPVPNWPVAIEVQDPSGTPVVTRTAQTNTSGTYALTFKLPTNARLGTYTVYVSAGYKGETAANSTTFVIGPVHNIDTHLSYMTIQAAIDASETLDGHTIFVDEGTYYEHVKVYKSLSLIGKQRSTTIIDGNHVGNVTEVTADNVSITNFTIQNSGSSWPYFGFICGIYIRSDGTNVSHDTVIDCERGIGLFASSNNRIFENDLTNNVGGVSLDSSGNNSITENTMANGSYGMTLLESSNNSIVGNDIEANDAHGIWLFDSPNNSFVGNNIESSAWAGMILYQNSNNNSIVGNNITRNRDGVSVMSGSLNNSIYHNNFVNNTNQALAPLAFWDDGYPSGGNYWSDYTGVDNHSGPHQNETGSDGIGDTPYVIDENNQDDYPLIKPYPWGLHDIGIAGITTSKTVVGQGFNLNINITIFNYGDNTETFNVTVYCNETAITLPDGENYTTVTLASGESTTVAIAWNTAGFAIGNYTISAIADTVSGETDTTDNTCMGGIVTVTIPGDLNGDFKVSLADLVTLAIAYGSRPGDIGWNPKADIDGNSVVGLSDLVILANHYGQQFP